MKTTYSLVLLTVLFGCGVMPHQNASSGEATSGDRAASIVNASFEDGLTDWQVRTGSYEVTVDTTESYSGFASMLVSGARGSWFYAVPEIKSFPMLGLSYGAVYEISFMAKCRYIDPSTVVWSVGQASTNSSCQKEWTEYQLPFVADAQSQVLNFSAYLAPSGMDETFNAEPKMFENYLWIDDIQITLVEEAG